MNNDVRMADALIWLNAVLNTKIYDGANKTKEQNDEIIKILKNIEKILSEKNI